jgi:hypothetical protein
LPIRERVVKKELFFYFRRKVHKHTSFEVMDPPKKEMEDLSLVDEEFKRKHELESTWTIYFDNPQRRGTSSDWGSTMTKLP